MTTPILLTRATIDQYKLNPTELIQDTADEKFLANYYGLLAAMMQAWRKGYSGVKYNAKSFVEASLLDNLMTRYGFTTVRTEVSSGSGAAGSSNLVWYWVDLDNDGLPKTGLGLVEITNPSTQSAQGINNVANLATLMMTKFALDLTPTASELGVTDEYLQWLALVVEYQRATLAGDYSTTYTASTEGMANRLRDLLREVTLDPLGEDPTVYFTVEDPSLGFETVVAWSWPEPPAP